MIRNPIPKLTESIVLADFKKHIPTMYRHFFEVGFTHQGEQGLRHKDTLKITITTSDNAPGLHDKNEAVQRAKDRLQNKGLKDIKMGVPRHVRTTKADQL